MMARRAGLFNRSAHALLGSMLDPFYRERPNIPFRPPHPELAEGRAPSQGHRI